MKAIPPALGFPALIVAKDQKEYLPLPAEYYGDPRYGTDALITRWRLEPDERKRIAQPEIARALVSFAMWLAAKGLIRKAEDETVDAAAIRFLGIFGKEAGINLLVDRSEDARVDLYHTQLLFGGPMQPIRMFYDSRELAVKIMGAQG